MYTTHHSRYDLAVGNCLYVCDVQSSLVAFKNKGIDNAILTCYVMYIHYVNCESFGETSVAYMWGRGQGVKVSLAFLLLQFYTHVCTCIFVPTWRPESERPG